MSKILALFVPSKIKGYIGSSQKFLDGKKSYIAGAILILQGILNIVIQYIACGESTSCVISMIQGFSSNEGVLLIANGLAVMGIRHAVSKAADGSSSASASEVPADAKEAVKPASETK